ncbi:Smr protein/MutS2 [Thermodesulfobium narugense DSM 14796]|uniref:Endonuclease MutS2 n=1 Tax=Thermodesulfobium narugense DSM 14796 TaxID=747365 RepID=M1E8B9_9BACT|nr:Smr/MutS family protein [Thermodesulfobium narugense]AEE14384.1 Smr protein/MutS2 [Thermodesulfobium narugense DSM 14796]
MSFKFDADDLDYKDVLKIICKKAFLPFVKENILNIKPLEIFELKIRQKCINDAINIIWKYSDPRERLQEIAIDSLVNYKNHLPFSFKNYFGLLLFLKAVSSIREFFLKTELNFNFFYDSSLKLNFPQKFFNLLINIFDDEGNIKDSASEKLGEIRKNIKKLEKELNSLLNDYIRGENKKYFQESIILERNGFYLLPVKIEYLDKIPGTIRDTSASGLTAYVEPYISAQIVSKIRLKREEELNELKLILKNLDKNFSDNKAIIQECVDFYETVDFFFSLGIYAKENNCIKPEYVDEMVIDFKNAKHPLLKNPIGQDFLLNKNLRGFILTGPNGGGKSVALKNLGLNVFLALSGLFVHASSAKIGPFKGLYSDLCDIQDLSLGLSSFTYHIDRLKHFLENDLKNVIILIDELGSGTDPKEGYALAKSIIKYLLTKGAFVCITTHIAELKITNIEGFQIAIGAMEYDKNSNLPTYRLVWNSVGNSHALDVAKKMGLPLEIISDAKEYLIGDRVYNEMIKLNELTEFYYKKVEELNNKEKILENERKFLKEKFEQLERDMKEQYEEKISQLNKLLSSVNLVAKELKRNLNQPKKDLVLESLKKWEELSSLINEKVLKREETSKDKIEINIGDYVNISTMNISGKVIKKQGKRSLVQTDKSKIWVDNSLLVFDKNESDKKLSKEYSNTFSVLSNLKNMGPNVEISVRGLRAEEAIQRVEKFIDKSLISNVPYVRIVHGKGEGILRKIIHEILEKHPQVKSFNLADPHEGGAGVTIVHFK